MGGEKAAENLLGLLAAAQRGEIRRPVARGRPSHRQVPVQQPPSQSREEDVGLTGLHGLGRTEPFLEPFPRAVRILRGGIAVVWRAGVVALPEIERHHGSHHGNHLMPRQFQINPPHGRAVHRTVAHLLEPLLDRRHHPAGDLLAGLRPGQHHRERRPVAVPPAHHQPAADIALKGGVEVGQFETVFLERLFPARGRRQPEDRVVDGGLDLAGLLDEHPPQPLEPVGPQGDGAELGARSHGLDELCRLRQPHHQGRVGRETLPRGPQFRGLGRRHEPRHPTDQQRSDRPSGRRSSQRARHDALREVFERVRERSQRPASRAGTAAADR